MRFLTLLLCLLTGCSDDDELESQGNCRADKRVSLSAWCNGKPECELPLMERWNQVCTKTDCAKQCYESWRNACGGYTISLTVATDVYGERYHYNADGALVGVTVYPLAIPCAVVKDVYGMDCAFAGGPLECSPADAG